MKSRLQICWLGLLCILLLAGCGGGTGDLKGTVTYKDQPLRLGSVVVVGRDGVPRSGTIQEDGSFSVTGVPAGPVKIAVSSPNPGEQVVGLRKKDDVKPVADSSKWVAIPDKYGDFDKSELVFNLKKRSNTFDIELK